MSFGLIVIGDEILSGKREDQHLSQVIRLLRQRGLALHWAHYLPDEVLVITEFLRRSFSNNDIVFCTGGIGATPDDHTRQAAAAAASVPLQLHPEAARLIEQRANQIATEKGWPAPVDMNSAENQQRLRMAQLPRGCELIANPFNQIPGFSIGQHYFVPGFPVMAWPMIESVLDQHYAHLFHKHVEHEHSVVVQGAFEARLTPLMTQIEKEFPSVKVFSLPSIAQAGQRAFIELGVKGGEPASQEAFAALLAGLRAVPGAELGEIKNR